MLKGYKSRLRKMQAVQRDSNGGFRINVEAQVAEAQLFKVQQDIISSSVKTANLSLVIGTRTSRPAMTTAELEQSERTIDNRRQQLLYAISRMNGAKAVAESLAKKRLFLSSLPAMAEPTNETRTCSLRMRRICCRSRHRGGVRPVTIVPAGDSLPPTHSFFAL